MYYSENWKKNNLHENGFVFLRSDEYENEEEEDGDGELKIIILVLNSLGTIVEETDHEFQKFVLYILIKKSGSLNCSTT